MDSSEIQQVEIVNADDEHVIEHFTTDNISSIDTNGGAMSARPRVSYDDNITSRNSAFVSSLLEGTNSLNQSKEAVKRDEERKAHNLKLGSLYAVQSTTTPLGSRLSMRANSMSTRQSLMSSTSPRVKSMNIEENEIKVDSSAKVIIKKNLQQSFETVNEQSIPTCNSNSNTTVNINTSTISNTPAVVSESSITSSSDIPNTSIISSPTNIYNESTISMTSSMNSTIILSDNSSNNQNVIIDSAQLITSTTKTKTTSNSTNNETTSIKTSVPTLSLDASSIDPLSKQQQHYYDDDNDKYHYYSPPNTASTVSSNLSPSSVPSMDNFDTTNTTTTTITANTSNCIANTKGINKTNIKEKNRLSLFRSSFSYTKDKDTTTTTGTTITGTGTSTGRNMMTEQDETMRKKKENKCRMM